jgi:hypothetical protein
MAAARKVNPSSSVTCLTLSTRILETEYAVLNEDSS